MNKDQDTRKQLNEAHSSLFQLSRSIKKALIAKKTFYNYKTCKNNMQTSKTIYTNPHNIRQKQDVKQAPYYPEKCEDYTI